MSKFSSNIIKHNIRVSDDIDIDGNYIWNTSNGQLIVKYNKDNKYFTLKTIPLTPNYDVLENPTHADRSISYSYTDNNLYKDIQNILK